MSTLLNIVQRLGSCVVICRVYPFRVMKYIFSYPKLLNSKKTHSEFMVAERILKVYPNCCLIYQCRTAISKTPTRVLLSTISHS